MVGAAGMFPGAHLLRYTMSDYLFCDARVAVDRRWTSGAIGLSVQGHPSNVVYIILRSNNTDMLFGSSAPDIVCTIKCDGEYYEEDCTIEEGVVCVPLTRSLLVPGKVLLCELYISGESNDKPYSYRSALFSVVVYE